MSIDHPAAHPRALPPIAVAISFVDGINRLDLEGLVDLMTDDHELRVADEPPIAGRAANRDAWRQYFEAWPRYVVYPERLAERDGTVAILGSTTGSHLDLPDADERAMPVIWVCEVRAGRVARWSVLDDAPEARAQLGLANPEAAAR